ncbi:MAG: glycosyltransferase family 4 protein [Planctomycetota bacterium]
MKKDSRIDSDPVQDFSRQELLDKIASLERKQAELNHRIEILSYESREKDRLYNDKAFEFDRLNQRLVIELNEKKEKLQEVYDSKSWKLIRLILDQVQRGTILLRKTIYAYRDIQKKLAAQFRTPFNLSEQEIATLKLLLEMLEIDIPTSSLLAHLEKAVSKNDVSDLKTLLRHFASKPPSRVRNPSSAVRRIEIRNPANRPPSPLNILFICGEFPNSIHGGGLRVSDFIKILSRENNIYLYTWYIKNRDKAALDSLKPYCKEIVGVPYKDFKEGDSLRLKELIGNTPFDVVHYEWPRSVLHYKPDLGKHHIFTYMEAVSLRLIMDMSREKPLGAQWTAKMIELIKKIKIEVLDSQAMDAHIVVTQKDGEFLSRFNADHPYYIVNHGINLDEFCLPDVSPDANTIVFVGNYGHYPNEDAVIFFFNHIHHRVREKIPDLKVYIVGATPTEKVQAFHNNKDVFVTGTVKDIRPFIQKASVSIAPLITGAGLRSKVVQYSALRRICVATSIAATDLTYEDGKDIFIADDPELFAERIVFLLQNPDAACTMSEKAYVKSRERYDNCRSISELYSLYNQLNLDKAGTGKIPTLACRKV